MDANVRDLMTQLRQNPLNFGVLDALRRHCEATQSYAIWAEALEHHARAASDAEGDPIELGRLHYELGNLYRTRLGRSDRALDHYRTAIDFDAAQRSALAAARTILTESGEWEQVIELLTREVESLPGGRKRAAKLLELASLYRTQLEDRGEAIAALREAVGYTPENLQAQHELATALLDAADHGDDAREAEALRREAADVLLLMARAVSDDYALAYTEAALDAVPDHSSGLALLEELAPRMGRGEALAPRWLAAIGSTRDRRFERSLRLKMASAYVAVGQLADARICLQPLLDASDPEAFELARQFADMDEPDDEANDEQAFEASEPDSEPSSEVHDYTFESFGAAPEQSLDMRGRALQGFGPAPEPSTEEEEDEDEDWAAAVARSNRAAELEQGSEEYEGEDSEQLASSELLLDAELEGQLDRELEGQLEEQEDADDPDAIAGELSDLTDSLVPDEPDDPLAGLASLDREASGFVGDHHVEDEPLDAEHELRALLEARAAQHEREHAASEQRPVAHRGFADDLPSHEELLDLEELAVESSERALGAETQAVAAARPNEPRDGFGTIEPRAPTHESNGDSSAPRAPEPVRSSKPPGSAGVFGFHPPHDAEEADPFAEQTQPRATPLTLAELTALTGRDERHLMATSDDDGAQPESGAEVTQITPAEDPQITEARSLRAELSRRLRFRDRRGAAEVAEALLDRGMFDPEAIEALEEHYRLSRDFRRLRDLSMRIAREPSFSSEVRSARLREAVMLSESKLGDQDGAAAALRELLTLEPHDPEAFDKLKRVLRRAQRWDELATLFEQRASEPGEPHVRAELLRELGAIQRDKRGALEPAIAAFAAARALGVGEGEDEAALSELYLATGRYGDAAEMYEARLARAQPPERAPLLAMLAKLYEEQLQDDERAQRALEAWRALEPRRPDPLHALIRIFERRGDHRALVDALVEQLELATASDRARIHVRIAEIALHRLGDANRAADSYAEAIATAPQEQALWRAAVPAFEQAGRAEELDELLWGLAQGRRDRALQAALFEHLAQARAARGDLPGAILTREAQFAATQSVSALEQLIELLRAVDRAPDLARRLDELARRSEPPRARALRLERAGVLTEKLRDPEAAKNELERVLTEFGTDDAQALRMLVDLSVATGDTARRASAQERLIKLAPSLEARVELAVELVDLYERVLYDAAGAMRVLTLWTTLEPQNPQPYLRLAPLLAQAGKKRELIDTLDRLAALAITDDEAGEFLLRAARVAMEIEDYDGAWNRLVPRVVESRDTAAEVLLRELASSAGRNEQLAALYVGLAQRAQSPSEEKQRWADAARVFERQVGAYDRALEAMLRALAKELDNRELLGEVERLAEHARAWPRLAQVYDTIVRKADSTETRIQLLMRHAHIVEIRAQDTRGAFERVWLAFQLDPSIDESYGEAKRLALATGKREELLLAYERRAQSSASREARLEALLDACAQAQHELEDRARATGYLARAVALAGDSAPLLNDIEARAQALDEAVPAIHGRGLLAELADVYVQLAAEHDQNQAFASLWYARAAHIHERTLDDPEAAFRALEHASRLAPNDETLLDELYRVAALADNWEALATHLQHTAEAAIDSNSSSAALSRLGALCERELASPSRAADAYEQLVRLRPKDADASRRLRICLQAAERYDELLIAIDRELFMLKPEQGRRELLKQAAETWEFGIKNRYEALDAWKKVAALAPADPEAAAALARLRSRPRVEDSLLEEAVVVLPEDLRPSLGVKPVDASLFNSPGVSDIDPGSTFFGVSTPATPSQQKARQPETAAESPEAEEQMAAAEDALEDALERGPELDGELLEASLEDESSLESDDAVVGDHTPGAVAIEPRAGARERSNRQDRDLTVADDELAALMAGVRDEPEPPPPPRDFDADVTLQLERDPRGTGEETVSLEGLSSLIENAPSSPPSPPRVPPPLPGRRTDDSGEQS